jgi:hypothetical protein
VCFFISFIFGLFAVLRDLSLLLKIKNDNCMKKVEDSKLVPGHLNFLRLLRLYSSGGVYLGFSFLLSRPFDLDERIVDLGPNWLKNI